ncbi:hypothetical protein [Mycolicibacter minnesotensis]
MTYPTLSQVRRASWEHLRTNAAAWASLAHTWETAFTEIRDASATPGGTPWTGAGAGAFQHETTADVVTVRAPADMLTTAANIAGCGAQTQDGNKQSLLNAVAAAERDDFQVLDDYTVIDNWTNYLSEAERDTRQNKAETHSRTICSRVETLGKNEDQISRNLTTATTGLHHLNFPGEGADGGAGGNEQSNAPAPADPDPSDAARQRDEAIVNDPDADPVARQLAQERLDDLRNSEFIGPLPTDPVLGGDARTRAQARRQFQEFLESGLAYPDRPPLTPDQATEHLDQMESQAREMVLGNFAKQLESAGVSAAGVRQALDEVQSGKSPRQLIHEAGSGISSGVGGLGSGLGSQARAANQGNHWRDVQVWSKADADALKSIGRKLGNVGIGLDAFLTFDNIVQGAPADEELARLGGRTFGGMGTGFLLGSAWGSLVGPEGTVIVGLLGAIAGGLMGDKVVSRMFGG